MSLAPTIALALRIVVRLVRKIATLVKGTFVSKHSVVCGDCLFWFCGTCHCAHECSILETDKVAPLPPADLADETVVERDETLRGPSGVSDLPPSAPAGRFRRNEEAHRQKPEHRLVRHPG